MNRQAEMIEKLMEAKKLQIEALMMCMPESVQGHMDTIGKEVKAMMIDLAMEAMKDHNEKAADDSDKKVRKVDIG